MARFVKRPPRPSDPRPIEPLSPNKAGFDLALELLALLSVHPASLIRIKIDLDLRSTHELAKVREEALRKYGVPVRLIDDGHRRYSLWPNAVGRAKQLASDYWDKMGYDLYEL